MATEKVKNYVSSDKILAYTKNMMTMMDKPTFRSLANKNPKEAEELLQKKNNILYTNYKHIYTMILTGNMDLQKLRMMLALREKIEKKEIDIQNASSCVGKILMDEYVTPQLEKNNN
jgi:hypothetical protein